MITALLLASVHGAKPIIPLSEVASTYFDCDEKTLRQKISKGKVTPPITLLDPTSQKGRAGVSVEHLAQYIDLRAKEAAREINWKAGQE